MKIIECPNCQKLLEFREDQVQNTVRCPRCGNTAILEDSQMIVIANGEMSGPDFQNLQAGEEELIIQDGEVRERAKDETNTDEAVESDTLSANETVQLADFSDTIEEKSPTFEWNISAKEPETQKSKPKTKRNVAEPAGKNRTPARDTKKRTRRGPSRRVAKRVYPWYYSALFYGICGFLLMLLILFTIWRYYEVIHKGKSTSAPNSPQEIWQEAENAFLEADVLYQEALEAIAEKTVYYAKLNKASGLLRKAMDLGAKSMEAQIEFLIEYNNMERDAAQKYAREEYGGYYQKIEQWEQLYRQVRKKLGAGSG